MKKLLSFILIIFSGSVLMFLPACGNDAETDRSNYEIYVSYDKEDKTLTGTVKLDYFNNTDNELNDLKFNLYGNAFRENSKFKPVSETYKNRAYYNGESYGEMTVKNVENCAGWTVAGEDENILTVNLSSPIGPEQRYCLTINYTLKLADVNHRTGVTATTVNLGNFYPVLCAYSKEGFIECPYYYCGDPFISECSDYSVTIELPAEYTVASSGKPESETEADGKKKCSYSLKNARDFAMVLSDKFQTVKENVNGVEVSYYYTNDNNPQISLSAATQSVKYFGDVFGAYAYPTLSVVQTDFCYGGMEYPALTMISRGLDSDNHIYTIVHENAHQWWYAMVGSDQLNNAWQDEGLTEYSTLMFFENNPNYGFTRTGIVKSATSAYRAFFSVFQQLNGEVNTAMTRNLKDYSGELEYNNITYNKGLIMFDMIRNSVGDAKFNSALKNYFNANRYKIASAEDLYGEFIKTGNLPESYFLSFTEGKILI